MLRGFKNNFLKNRIKFVLIEIHNNHMYTNYNPKVIENHLKKNNFILKKRFKFPFLAFEDRLYLNKKKIDI